MQLHDDHPTAILSTFHSSPPVQVLTHPALHMQTATNLHGITTRLLRGNQNAHPTKGPEKFARAE
jgi:hypothetical protein